MSRGRRLSRGSERDKRRKPVVKGFVRFFYDDFTKCLVVDAVNMDLHR